MYTNYPFGVCLAHNGNLTNVRELKETVFAEARHINTDSVSERVCNALSKYPSTPDKAVASVFFFFRWVLSLTLLSIIYMHTVGEFGG